MGGAGDVRSIVVPVMKLWIPIIGKLFDVYTAYF